MNTPYDTAENGKYHLPNYLRIQRSGDNLLFSVSDSGTDWKDNARQPYTMKISGLANKLYVGVAIDSQQGQSDASPQAYYSMAKFSNLKLENQSEFDRALQMSRFRLLTQVSPIILIGMLVRLVQRELTETLYKLSMKVKRL